MNFEDEIIRTMKSKVISEISKTDFIKIDYGQKRPIPDSFLNKAWNSIDWDVVLDDVRDKMQIRICNAIVGNMEKEIKTDVKSILSIDGVRQKLRVEIYPKLMNILDDENKCK